MQNTSRMLWQKGAFALLGTAVLLCLTCCDAAEKPAKNGAERAEQAAVQTIMIYMVGSDLESENGAASGDLAEISAAGADTAAANIVVLTGGTTQWQSDVPADESVTYRLNGARWELVNQTAVRNMGEAQTLSDFLQYCCQTYPAESYALVLWDHGGGPVEGYGYDQQHAFDHLTLPEMRQALQNSPFGPGKLRLAWVGFDACLMSSIETADVFADYADYMIASQEAVPNRGWDYGAFSEAGRGLLHGAEAARIIIDAYADTYEALNRQLTNSKKMITLSCLDLSRIDAVELALDALSARLKQEIDRGAYSAIAKKRSDARTFGRFSLGRQFDLIDLGGLAAQFGKDAPGEAAALTSALETLVVYARSNQPDTSGVSIFFPYENTAYLADVLSGGDERFEWQAIYEQLGFAPEYSAFLYHFSRNQTAAPHTNWDSLSSTFPAYDMEAGEYYLQLTPEQVENYSASAFYILGHVEGEEYMPYYMGRDLTLDERGRLYANYDECAIYVVNDETGSKALPLVFEEETVGDIVRCRFSTLLSRWTESILDSEFEHVYMHAELDRAQKTVSIVGAIPADSTDDKPRGKQEVNFADWKLAQFTSYGCYLTRGSDGVLLPFSQWETSDMSRGWEFYIKDGFHVEYLPLDDTPYDLFCTITVKDTQGNLYASPLMPVADKKDGAAAEDATQEETAPISVSFAVNQSEPEPLLEAEGVSIRLTKLEYDDWLNTLNLTLEADNRTDQELTVYLEDVCVGDWRISGSSINILPADSSAEQTLRLEIESDGYQSSMQDCGITNVETLSFRLRYELNTRDMPERLVTVHTGFDPRPYYAIEKPLEKMAVPFVPQRLYHKDGVAVELIGAYLNSQASHLTLAMRLENGGGEIKNLYIRHLSVNGVMLSDNASETILPGPMRGGVRQSFFVRIGVDEMTGLGLSSVETLAFAVEITDAEGNMQREWVTLTPTAPLRLSLVRMMEPSRAESEGARVVLDRNGVRVTQLAGLAEGTYAKTFVVENNTPFLLHITDRDGMVNGEIPCDYIFSVSDIAPGKRAYKSLRFIGEEFSNVSSVDSLDLRLMAVDVDANALLFASGPIELTF